MTGVGQLDQYLGMGKLLTVRNSEPVLDKKILRYITSLV